MGAVERHKQVRAYRGVGAVAGQTVGGLARGQGQALDGDRSGCQDRGCVQYCGGVRAGGVPLVLARWRRESMS